MNTRSSADRPLRVAVAVRFVWGATLLLGPGMVLRVLDREKPTAPARRILRVLGARHVMQSAAEWRFGALARRIGIGVDTLHVATDLAFAGRDRRWRRAAETDALVTTSLVVLALVDA